MVTQRNAVDYTLEVKKAFVVKHLTPMLTTLFADIKEVNYCAENEIVTIDFKDGGVKQVNVGGNSCLQIAKDVLAKFN